jgi:hypothetical protein
VRTVDWSAAWSEEEFVRPIYLNPASEMKVSFLISANAFLRLSCAAMARGWGSDPEYAQRTVERLLAGDGRNATDTELDVETLSNLAAMRGEFEASSLDEIVRAIAGFFSERPRRVEVEGVEYAVGRTLGMLTPLPA